MTLKKLIEEAREKLTQNSRRPVSQGQIANFLVSNYPTELESLGMTRDFAGDGHDASRLRKNPRFFKANLVRVSDQK